MGFYQLQTMQRIPASREKVWDFISSPANLKKITPKHMGFDIISRSIPEKMYPGLIIAYRVSPLFGMKLTWVTEITHVQDGHYFVDEQRIGPYAMWHHEHILEPIDEGVLMKDIVSYKPPLGFLGTLANKILIHGQLRQIFSFREKAIENIFGMWSDRKSNGA